jgi:hypothetical protein
MLSYLTKTPEKIENLKSNCFFLKKKIGHNNKKKKDDSGNFKTIGVEVKH